MNKILNHPMWNTHALLIGRIMMGVFFLLAGINKLNGGIEGTAGMIADVGFPASVLLAWVVALTETGAGLGLILGKYFRESALALAVLVLIITVFIHWPEDWANSMQVGGFMKNMGLMGGLLFMAAHGVGNTWRLKM